MDAGLWPPAHRYNDNERYWMKYIIIFSLRPLKNVRFYSRSKKTKILTTVIHLLFRGLEFESDVEIGKKRAFFKGLSLSSIERPAANRAKPLRFEAKLR
jgi:hypothetical protein